jgi:hypothetical protein
MIASAVRAQTNVHCLYSPEKLQGYILMRVASMEEILADGSGNIKPYTTVKMSSTNDIMSAIAKIAPGKVGMTYLIFKDDAGNMLFDDMATNIIAIGVQGSLAMRSTWTSIPIVFNNRVDYAIYTRADGQRSVNVGQPGNRTVKRYGKGSVIFMTLSSAGNGTLLVHYKGQKSDVTYDLSDTDITAKN